MHLPSLPRYGRDAGSAGACSRRLVPADGPGRAAVGDLDAGRTCPLQPRASDPASRNEALQHSANLRDTRATSRRRTRQIIRSVLSVDSVAIPAVVASAHASMNMSCVYVEMRGASVVARTRFHHGYSHRAHTTSLRIQASGNPVGARNSLRIFFSNLLHRATSYLNMRARCEVWAKARERCWN